MLPSRFKTLALDFGDGMSNAVTGPIFTADTFTGRKELGLFDLMGFAARAQFLDLPRMAAHQRASLVTVLAILMHVLSRYAKVERADASSWETAWDTLIGKEAYINQHISKRTLMLRI
jgi:hypothetical protein